MERTIERLLAAVDALLAQLDQEDGDADLEPALGSNGGMSASHNQTYWAGGSVDDHEEACEDEGAQDEREPDPSDCVPNYHPEDQRRVLKAVWAGEGIYCEA